MGSGPQWPVVLKTGEVEKEKWRGPGRGRGAGLTGHKVAEADSGDGDEGVVEALDVVPLLSHHEHEGWDHQVHQDAPHDEDGRARDLSLPLVGWGGGPSQAIVETVETQQGTQNAREATRWEASGVPPLAGGSPPEEEAGRVFPA